MTTKRQDVMVLVDPKAPGGLQAVEQALREAGMTGVQVLRTVGAIAGKVASASAVAKIADVPGVLRVDSSADDHHHHIPPPR